MPTAAGLSTAELCDMIRAAQAGDDAALGQVVAMHTGQVKDIAQRYLWSQMPLEDLEQEGQLGLLHAIGKFDPARGFRLTTMAHWWIRQAILRAVHNHSRMIRLPVYLLEAQGRVLAARARLEQELGCAPTLEEIAAAVEPSAREHPMTVARVAQVLDLPLVSASLDATYGEGGDAFYVDAIVDDEEADQDDTLFASELKTDVKHLLTALKPKERRVLEMRFGLDGAGERTLQEIAVELHMSREGVRHIETRALARLRKVAGSERESLLENMG